MHTPGELIGKVEATYLTDGCPGYTECTGCGQTVYLVGNTWTVIDDLEAWKSGAGNTGKADHQYKKIDKVNPTCTEDGHKEYYQCEVCNACFEKNATGYAAIDLDTWAAENGAGFIAALGHDWDNGKEKAACEEDGVKTFACKRKDCHETKTESIPAIGHNYEIQKVGEKGDHAQVVVKCKNKDCGKTLTATLTWGDNGAYLVPATENDGYDWDSIEISYAAYADPDNDPEKRDPHHPVVAPVNSPADATCAYIHVSGEKEEVCQFHDYYIARELPVLYTVTFVSNGGTEVESQTVEENKTAVKPDDPTKEGYNFDGWYADRECTTLYNFDAAVNEDITLYAKWAEDEKPAELPNDNRPTGGTTIITTTPAVAPKTADAGIAIYGMLSVMSVMGTGLVIGKKKEF